MAVQQDAARDTDSEGWVKHLRQLALAVFIAVPILAVLLPSIAGRVVWTILIAALPLFIVVVGYHRWRRICPLAFFAQLPGRLKRAGKHKAPPWLEARYYYVAFAIFWVSLWLRLIATNGNGYAIAAFFVLLTLAALLFGSRYTGKTWCNYVCPVSFVEKLYTEPHGLRETPNSQCAKCTACKQSCPDINEENGYWKEIASRPKRFVWFAFPGLVFGFYFYYYLQSGTWNYYFGGSWTNQPKLIHTVFLLGRDHESAGFFFFPAMPRALAAILTLTACGLFSFLMFSVLEAPIGRWLRRSDPEADKVRTRHVMFSIAAFTAFVTFYMFAGAPTLRRIPGAPPLFAILVVVVATVSLVRRLPRTRKGFAEGNLARNFIKHWPWPDVQPPRDPREAFLVHTIRLRESAKGYEQVLQTYTEAVRETVADGFIGREDLQLMESLRDALQIKDADYAKIIDTLVEEQCARESKSLDELTPEKHLQLESYAEALKRYLEGVLSAGGVPNKSLLSQLRGEYRVTREEHAVAMDQVFREISRGNAGLLLNGWNL
jgi:polyferredoxin